MLHNITLQKSDIVGKWTAVLGGLPLLGEDPTDFYKTYFVSSFVRDILAI